MDDLISREAAIAALKNQMSDWNDDYNVPVRKSIDNIERLPSAQPEIIRCMNCKYYKRYACHYSIGRTVIREPDDFCSRAERR